MWFNGWDEMSQEIQKQSFIASFIRQDALQSSLPGCTIAGHLTIRNTSDLNGLKMSKVELESLNPSQVVELVTKNTEGTGHNANELLTALESKAALSRFCSLPITVTILIHLFFTFGANIPTTQTELFRCLILNLLLRTSSDKMASACEDHWKDLILFLNLPTRSAFGFFANSV